MKTDLSALDVGQVFVNRAGLLTQYGQYWLAAAYRLLAFLIAGIRPIVEVSTSRTLTIDDSAGILRGMISCSGTITVTLPDVSTAALAAKQKGRSYYFFNEGSGVISIAGTVNGDVLGYTLPNQYDFVEITGNGTDWYVTENN